MLGTPTTEELEDEIENEDEELNLFDFMVEDKEPTERACITCKVHKVGSQVCGIFKCYNDFITLEKGKESIEQTFSCSNYREIE